MYDFLKRLFNNQDRNLAFVVFDEDEPKTSTTYHFKPADLWHHFYASLALVVVITTILFMFTPVGNLLYSQRDARLRAQAIEISKRVQALQDSLQARNRQLTMMRQVIASGSDTSFSVKPGYKGLPAPQDSKEPEPETVSSVNNSGMLTQNEIIFSNIFKKAPDFPASYPVEGTFTRGYNPQNGHYGIDIATREGHSFKAIADGAVVNQDWTINYGYVLHVQHSNGIITVYKHAASLSKSVGDIVLEGDVLGTAGDAGILSTGPHLHIEIWKNGVPQNPNLYLIKS